MLFTPLKQNLDRVSKKLSSLEQRQTAQNSQNALSSSHDALLETETQLDWLGNLDGGTTSLSGPSFSQGSSNVKTHRPQSSSQHHSVKVKSEPVDHGYDLATANQNDEMSVSQETEGSPSQLLFPQMTEDGGITFESLIGDDEGNKTTIDSKPGPSTKPDIIPRKRLKLEHHSKESNSSWMPAGSEVKLSAFQDKCSDAVGLKVIQEGSDSDDDFRVSGSDQYTSQEGAMGHLSPPEFKKPTVITPVKNVVRGPSQDAPLQEFACFTQVVDSMEDTEECTEDEARLLRMEKKKLRKDWNQQCKRAAGTPYSALGKNQGRGQLKAIHEMEVKNPYFCILYFALM
ncbi:uncharacterized protein LOC118403333 [Branchiostoma floridae]|uniref:Uncharacterized protein LOC118403333 n=1 Tax=Branchiostoma floridae TaxID=7739 RepID=A0A9J7KGJ4_BRAFL|nr:uncharacterized protein LOC118403333 [Branchiostoma floridae]